MSLRATALRPIGGIKNDTLRRAALVVYGAPVVIALQVGQVLLAPVAILIVFWFGVFSGIVEAFRETVDCILGASRAEPESWRVLFGTLKRIWRWDRETWISKQPRILAKKPNKDPQP